MCSSICTGSTRPVCWTTELGALVAGVLAAQGREVPRTRRPRRFGSGRRAAAEAAGDVHRFCHPQATETETAAPVQAPAFQTAPERPVTSRRPAAKKAVKPATDPRFPHGPLAVLDGDGSAYGVVLDCPATTVPELVEWTLKEAVLGAAKLNRYGKDSDPLIVLTTAAAVKLGLPERLVVHEQRRSLRLPEGHPVVKQVTKAKSVSYVGLARWAGHGAGYVELDCSGRAVGDREAAGPAVEGAAAGRWNAGHA
ncbi:hypothetical protein ACIO8F_30030 [Streptomyces sp. NPDC087228]|uniref:hypothetical protein n=1 Tax=Streptomyces sp. NPDC087228 TaxID=3365772 RepID=UPI0037FB1500